VNDQYKVAIIDDDADDLLIYYKKVIREFDKDELYSPDPILCYESDFDKIHDDINLHTIDLILLDLNFGSGKEEGGLDFLVNFYNYNKEREVDEYPALDAKIIIYSGFEEILRWKFKINTMYNKYGVVDFIDKDEENLLLYKFKMDRAITFGSLEKKLQRAKKNILKNTGYTDEELKQLRKSKKLSHEPLIIYQCEKMKELLEKVEMMARTDHSILIEGETGTGKELIARKIGWLNAKRKGAPFVAFNSASLVSTLAAAQLFGYVKGSHSGADDDKIGYIQIAHQGTLFLDEIGDMPMDQQVMLLRVIQEGEVARVGTFVTEKVDIRFISATNQTLNELIKDNKEFRKDLFYRLSTFKLKIPPLRERDEDIILLAMEFLEKEHENAKAKKYLPTFSEGVKDKLLSYDWPGNVRQLENVIQYTYAYACYKNKSVIDQSCLPDDIFSYSPDDNSNENDLEVMRPVQFAELLWKDHLKAKEAFIKKHEENDFEFLMNKGKEGNDILNNDKERWNVLRLEYFIQRNKFLSNQVKSVPPSTFSLLMDAIEKILIRENEPVKPKPQLERRISWIMGQPGERYASGRKSKLKKN
jgi:DNA-binding NtrC family response regulator